jgi:hypothetical protein
LISNKGWLVYLYVLASYLSEVALYTIKVTYTKSSNLLLGLPLLRRNKKGENMIEATAYIQFF